MGGDPFAFLISQHERILSDLIAFASIPSVSADPAHRSDVEVAARWIAGHLASAGPFAVQILPSPGNPVVFAEWSGAPGAPSVLVYGHYDVQPPDPLDKWLSDPFRAVERSGRLHGRGVSDDKGPLLIPIAAARAVFATNSRLPVNVKFILEGEEEIGSPNLEAFIAENSALLAADFVISADGAMWRSSEPSLTIACRGLAALEIRVVGPRKDLHSGSCGGAVMNTLHAMAHLVDSLHTSDGRVAVEGFYDDVLDVPPAERAEISALPFDEPAYREELGVSELFGEPGFSTLERQWIRPTLDVNGMWGGYEGPGSKTVLPAEAGAKITCRLVPDQIPEDIIDKVVRHLLARPPHGVSIEVLPETHAARPYRIPSDHIGLRVAGSALEQVSGRKPIVVRNGGTIPVCEVFKRVMGMETVFFSFSTSDEDFHAPNEFIRISSLHDGLEAWVRYWKELAVVMR